MQSAIAVEDVTFNSYLTSNNKRFLDVVVSIIGLALTIMLLPMVAVMVLANSGFPVFFRRERLGLHGIKFVMVKFRTMSNSGHDSESNLRTSKNDLRISRPGRFLRKTYIDELPQFWNVLKGEMSVVGPRPEFPELAVELGHIRKRFPDRLAAKPGITGLAQIRYTYSHNNAHAAGRLPYDLEYIKRASFRLDLWIIWQTIARAVKLNGT